VAVKLSVLASGSRGNSIYVATEKVALLIDAGLSARAIEERLQAIGASAAELDGLVVTHEHLDHVRGIGTLSRRYGLPVYVNEQTYRHLPDVVGELADRVEFVTGQSFAIADLDVHPFAISHDAVDPVGLTLVNGITKVGICTDLGVATRLVYHHLQRCQALVLEANHDLEMLKNGPYPWALKQRIRSRAGHLSNEETGEILAAVLNEDLREVILAHLSETNNCPQTAVKSLRTCLAEHRCQHWRLQVACQHRPTEMLILP